MSKSTALFRVISDNAALLEVCNLAQMKSAVALDTEFMRVSTYSLSWVNPTL